MRFKSILNVSVLVGNFGFFGKSLKKEIKKDIKFIDVIYGELKKKDGTY